jgi:hypothetical protein
LYWDNTQNRWEDGSTQIILGRNAAVTSQGASAVAIGNEAGNTQQGEGSIAIGYQSGNYQQGLFSVAVGWQTGQTQQGYYAVAIGYEAGRTQQGFNAVAIGNDAGSNNQGDNAIAIGQFAGNTSQGENAVAIGRSGRSIQGSGAVAIGRFAGNTAQGINAIAIGADAGRTSQGINAIAIGAGAGEGLQHPYTIILNAMTTSLNSVSANGFYVKPIRGPTSGTTFRNLLYDTTTSEISYGSVPWGNITTNPTKAFIIDHPDDPQNQYLVHACLEGPEVGVFYRGKGVITDNCSTTIQLPSYTKKLAFDYTVQLTPIGNSKRQIVLECSEVENGQFTVYGENVEFFWLVHANRNTLDVEPYKSSIKLHGDGPYKWASTF